MRLELASPEEAGFDMRALGEATAFAASNEIGWSRDLERALAEGAVDAPPYNVPRGPLAPRGAPNGVVMRRGRVAATWGDPDREDFTFSVAKSYLALLTGIALGDGLIGDIHEPLSATASDGDFASAQNRSITWHHLLQQTSEWEGTLFGIPDSVDRNREVGNDADNSRKGELRALCAPGSYWEYNDVRVNRLSLSLLQRFKRPLAEVLRERIMQPIGASPDWRWHSYYDAEVDIDGVNMPSVPGGTHWGGGICIDSIDHALVGELVRLDGLWQGQQLLPKGWCEQLFEPCPLKTDYGYLWWLNTDRNHMPGAPASSVFASGAGGNEIWVDRDLELVVVARWLDTERTSDFCAAVVKSLR